MDNKLPYSGYQLDFLFLSHCNFLLDFIIIDVLETQGNYINRADSVSNIRSDVSRLFAFVDLSIVDNISYLPFLVDNRFEKPRNAYTRLLSTCRSVANVCRPLRSFPGFFYFFKLCVA